MNSNEHPHPIQNDISFKFWRRIMPCIKFLENLSLPYILLSSIRDHSVTCHFTWMHLSKSVFLPGHLGLETIDFDLLVVSIVDSRAIRKCKNIFIGNGFIISSEFWTRKRNPFSITTKLANLHRIKSFIGYPCCCSCCGYKMRNFIIFSFYYCKWSLQLDNLTNSLKFCWFRKNFDIFHLN